MSDFIRAVGDTLTFYARTHALAGGHVDADSLPTYKFYEDETGTAILTGTMAKIDDAGTIGKYSEQVVLSEANGFEYLKDYSLDIIAIVGGVTDGFSYSLHMGRLSVRDNLQLDEGTALGYSANTLAARAGAPVIPVGARAFIESATTGALQESNVSVWTDGTKTATVDPPWPTTLTGTVKYRFFSGSAALTVDPPNVDLTVAAISAIVDALLDELMAGHTVPDSVAAKITASGAAGDPWLSALGGYGAGTAGALVVAINALVALIKSKTDNIPADPADASDIVAAFAAVPAAVLVAIKADVDIPTANEIVAVLKADGEWKTMLVGAGKANWTFIKPASFPGIGTFIARDHIGGIVRITLAIQFDAEGVPVSAASS